MPHYTSQSALEFLSTYAFVFLLLAIVISLLFTFASLPRSLLPAQCTFYSGFTCEQAIYTINTTAGKGAELLIVAVDTQPGIINVSSFSAYLNFHTSNAGICEPTVATAGQTIYCIANFTSTPTLANTYDGTFDIKANYCATGLNSLFNETCVPNSNFSYTGHTTIQASILSLSKIMLVPMTLTNLQNKAVPANFDQMVNFSASAYLPYVKSNLGNIRFYYRAEELYSWCESGCNSSSTSNSIFWIKLPVVMPPNSTMQINMYILPSNVNYTGKHAGEAPQLSCPNPASPATCKTYGKYDNGASVFTDYWNFAGTSLPSGWATTGTASVSVNNGVTITQSTGGALLYYTISLPLPLITDWYANIYSTSSWSDLGFGSNLNGCIFAYGIGDDSNAPDLDLLNQYGSRFCTVSNTGIASTNGNVSYTVSVGSNTSASIYADYTLLASSSSLQAAPISYLLIGSGVANLKQYAQWVRIRAYPPNGVMPKVTFGAIGPA